MARSSESNAGRKVAVMLLVLLGAAEGFVPSQSCGPRGRAGVRRLAPSRSNVAATQSHRGPMLMSMVSDAVTESGSEPDSPPAAVGEEEAAQPKLQWADLSEGMELEGVVNNVLPYGAFVDIGAAVNGLVHVSQLSDTFVQNPAEVVTIGDKVTVRIVKLDVSAEKIVLSMRSEKRPARTQRGDMQAYATMLEEEPGKFMPATVKSLLPYGAFVELADGASGFIHHTQLKEDSSFVTVTEELKVGDEVQVRLRDVDVKLQRINLSLLPVGVKSAEGGRQASADKDVSKFVGADPDEWLTGVVRTVTDYGAFVTVDGVDGLLHISKVSQGAPITVDEMKAVLPVGTEVQVRIEEVNPSTNRLSLSMQPASKVVDLSSFAARDPQEWMEGKVVSIRDFGVFVRVDGGFDGLVHLSELYDGVVEDINDIVSVGDTVKVRVLEVDQQRQRLRLSMREKSREARGSRSPSNVAKYVDIDFDEWLEGTVRTVTDFGAFVALDESTDGLVHISQLSDDHVDDPAEQVSVGDSVKVRILSVDTESNRISLSMRSESQQRGGGGRSGGERREPKDVSILLDVPVDEFLPGKVVAVKTYGCFVQLENGIDGLVHISQLADGHVDNVEDVVSMGQDVQVRVIGVDVDRNTADLSLVSREIQESKAAESSSYGQDQGSSDGGSMGQFDNQPKKSPKFRASGDGGSDSYTTGGSGESDWQKYLDQYFEKKDSL
jgi:small subunit ribosomal protein S1